MSNKTTEDRLYAAIREGRAPHAVLLAGPEGSRAGEIARRAAALCCTGSLDPAGLLTYPDYYALGPEPVGVNEVRDMQAKLSVKPLRDWRAVNLFHAERMTIEAQNALLKTLEEPPVRTFLLLSGREEGLLPTIRSRTALLRLGAEPVAAVYEALLDQGAVPDQARLAAGLSGGQPGLSRAFLSNEYRAFRGEAAALFIEALYGAPCPPYGGMRGLLDMLPYGEMEQARTPTEKQRLAAETILEIWLSLCRDALRLAILGEEPANLDRAAEVREMAKRFTIGQNQGIIEVLYQAGARLNAASPGLSMDRLLTDMLDLRQNPKPAAAPRN